MNKSTLLLTLAIITGFSGLNASDHYSELAQKCLGINNLMNKELSYTQAEHAVSLKVTTEKAIEKAKEGKLVTLATQILYNPSAANHLIKQEQENAKLVHEMAMYLHAGLDWTTARVARKHQASLMKEMLIKRNNENHDNSGCEEIIAQIKENKINKF